MSRRNVVRMNIRDGAVARQKAADSNNPTEPAKKRQKVTHDFFLTRSPTPLPREKEQTESLAVGGLKDVDKSASSASRAIVQEFAASFALAEGRVVSVEDSVKLEPGLAVTMLRGLALPNDMKMVLKELQPSLVHASAYLVQV